MFNKIILVLCLGVFFFSVIGLSYSQQVGEDATTGATMVQKKDVGNKICPVSGEKIEEKLKATYEYNGKIYNFCCVSCVEEFKKDPDKYIKRVNEELLLESKKEIKRTEVMPKYNTSTKGHEEMHH